MGDHWIRFRIRHIRTGVDAEVSQSLHADQVIGILDEYILGFFERLAHIAVGRLVFIVKTCECVLLALTSMSSGRCSIG